MVPRGVKGQMLLVGFNEPELTDFPVEHTADCLEDLRRYSCEGRRLRKQLRNEVLRLKPGFGLLAIGNIERGTDVAEETSIRRETRQPVIRDPAMFSVVSAQTILDPELFAFVESG